jgi:hypothetical protein
MGGQVKLYAELYDCTTVRDCISLSIRTVHSPLSDSPPSSNTPERGVFGRAHTPITGCLLNPGAREGMAPRGRECGRDLDRDSSGPRKRTNPLREDR